MTYKEAFQILATVLFVGMEYLTEQDKERLFKMANGMMALHD